MKLRPYQDRAVGLLLDHLDAYPNATPIGWLPTGSGKSVIAAALAGEMVARDRARAVLVVTHRRELVQQNSEKLPRHIHGSVFSAGLGKKDLSGQVIFASIQSITKHASKLPPLSAIIIDEPQFAAAGYFEFAEEIRKYSPQVRIIGLTATPYTGNGTWLHMLPKHRLFTGIAAEVAIAELLNDDYLSQLVPYRAATQLDAGGIDIDQRTGDYAQGALQAAIDIGNTNVRVATEITDIFAERKSVLVFCTGVEHTKHMAEALRLHGEDAAVVLASTPMKERDRLIGDFRAGRLKYLCSCEVVLVGFDATNTDGIACLRPTMSPLIWVQLLGRGMRIHSGKANCLVADFTANSETFPPVDEIEGHPPKVKLGDTPTKMCDNCFSLILAGLRICPVCGHEFEFQTREQKFDPDTGLLISGVIKEADGSKWYPVERVEYETRITRNGIEAVVANYYAPGRKTRVAEQWYNLFHHKPSVANRDLTLWLRRQLATGPAPMSAREALARAELGGMREPTMVKVAPGSVFAVGYRQ